MENEVFPVADSRIFIGEVLASKATPFVESDFAGQSWVEIDGWETMGAAGDTAALITATVINRGRDVKQKGTANGGQMQNQFVSLPEDEGQIALMAAAQPSNKSNYAFKLELSNGAKRYFIGLVMSAQEQGGGANTIQMLQSTIEINSNIVKVAA